MSGISEFGIIYPGDARPAEQFIKPVPNLFQSFGEDDPVPIEVIGMREIHINEKAYLLNGISTRLINACFALQADRNAFIPPADILEFDRSNSGRMNATELSRASKALQHLGNRAIDISYSVIDKQSTGWRNMRGSRAFMYRINPRTVFHDLRHFN